MIVQFETERTMLPTGSAAGWRGPIITAALVASVALILSACSSQSVTAASSATARYPDLNDPPPSARQVRADQVAQIKA
jgi:hypothetical protein